jgi:4-hydroxy-tetrahydrodipicolinate synthase
LTARTDLARQLNEPLEALHKHLFIESNPIPVKWALQQMGRIQTGIRLPLTWLTAESGNRSSRTAMQQAGLI